MRDILATLSNAVAKQPSNTLPLLLTSDGTSNKALIRQAIREFRGTTTDSSSLPAEQLHIRSLEASNTTNRGLERRLALSNRARPDPTAAISAEESWVIQRNSPRTRDLLCCTLLQ